MVDFIVDFLHIVGKRFGFFLDTEGGNDYFRKILSLFFHSYGEWLTGYFHGSLGEADVSKFESLAYRGFYVEAAVDVGNADNPFALDTY